MAFITPKEALLKYSEVYFKSKLSDDDFNLFKLRLERYKKDIKSAIKNDETEEFTKKLINDFLQDSFYRIVDGFNVNTFGNIDSSIVYNNELYVMIETKKPVKTSEMLLTSDINRKALHELIYYYLEQTRDTGGAKAIRIADCKIKNLIASNGYEWFIFDANIIEKICTGYLEKHFYDYKNSRLTYAKNNAKFYEDISTHLSKMNLNKINYVYFNVLDCKNKGDIGNLYELLSSTFLFKDRSSLPVKEHTLNQKFYQELLYIFGLKEEKKSKITKIVINNEIENTIAYQLYNKFKYDKDLTDEKIIEEKVFELLIIWLDRLLFIKLFEGQLFTFNGESEEYRILDNQKIKTFDDLMDLFFNVLGRKERQTTQFYLQFEKIPYLNSSLFEKQPIETKDVNINELRNNNVDLLNGTIFGKKAPKQLPILQYIIDFLNSYNFCSDANVNHEDNTFGDIIDASVLGLIFEKINGYKDGSFYTPSQITEYISKDVLTRIVTDKVNNRYSWNCSNLSEIRMMIDETNSISEKLQLRKDINELINSITICDPSVGSGHFLVSALNMILKIKYDLGVLFYLESDERVTDYKLDVINDVLTITNGQGYSFVYNKNDLNSQRLQETLFNEKRSIIEKCLFGADLNPKAVYICQLRLWIELLKNAYYKNGLMETLPNIDIKMVAGNSLIHKIDFNTKSFKYLGISEKTFKDFKKYRAEYIRTSDKSIKTELKRQINSIKSQMYNGQGTQTVLAGMGIVEEESGDFYNGCVEWAIEFPEIIENNKFVGFDCIIGNPPYGVKLNESEKEYLKKEYSEVHMRTHDTFNYFIALSIRLLNNDGYLSFIVPNNLLFQNEYEKTRQLLTESNTMLEVINLGDNIFNQASVPTCIFFTRKNTLIDYNISYSDLRNVNKKAIDFGADFDVIPLSVIKSTPAKVIGINENDSTIMKSIANKSVIIDDIVDDVSSGISTGGNKAFCVNKDFVDEQKLENELLKPLIVGKDIKKYFIERNNNYIIYSTKSSNTPNYVNIYNHLLQFESGLSKKRETVKGILPWWSLHWARNPKLFESKKIVIKQTCDTIVCAIDDKNYYALNSLIVLILNDDARYSYEYILGILNSRVTNFVYKNLTQEEGRGFAEVKPANVRKLYIPKMDNENQSLIEMYVEQIMNGTISTSDGMERIDRIIYKFFDFTVDEIAQIEKMK